MPTRKKIEISTLEKEYNDCLNDFQKFVNAVLTQLDELIESNEISLGFPVQTRIKEFKSISNKHEGGRFNIKKTILELQDIIGFRIVLLFKRDVTSVEKLLKDNFDIIKSYNTDEKLLDNQFGYSSIHFILKIKKEWLSIPTFRNLEKYQAEIQIRTLSQHIWAEISSALQYKVESNVPREILRSIGRVSALLETIDLELERTLNQRDVYIAEIDNEILKSNNLNVDILESILSKQLPLINTKFKDDYADLLLLLHDYNINTVDELETTLEKNIRYELDFVSVFDHASSKWIKYNLTAFDTQSTYIATMLYHIDQIKWSGLVKGV